MAGHICYHCKQFVAEGEPHDCWTTTEAALTAELTPDLQDAWERLRESAVELGEQRIYASHHSIMFSRAACHFFVRPKRAFLELTIFLGRAVNAPQIRRVRQNSRTKWTHVVHIRHRDEVEEPITGWMREAYGLKDAKKTKDTKKPKGLKERKEPKESKERAATPRRRSRASGGRTSARRSTKSRSGRARRRVRR